MAANVVSGQATRTADQDQERRADARSRFSFSGRVGLLVALFLCSYGVLFAQVLRDGIDGSRTAFLVVAPVLVVLATSGYRVPTLGVGDHESDWIIATLIGAVGFASISLIATRFPTLAGFWHLELITGLVWVACAGMIVFGVRHALRMWPVWLFAFGSALTLPYLLVTAALGGSDVAAAATSAALASFAVYLAGRLAQRLRQIGAAVLTLILGTGLSVLLAEPFGLFVTVLIVAGASPVLITWGVHRLGGPTGAGAAHDAFPVVSRRSQMALALIALVLLGTQVPIDRQPVLPLVGNDWPHVSGLVAGPEFGFITRFLGPHANLVRYELPRSGDTPRAAVDVITSTNLATLQAYSDAIWYPSPTPVDFEPADAATQARKVLQARVIHSNADAATNSVSQNWYAITWMWRTASAYQQVTVIVNQSRAEEAPPVNPAALSLTGTLIDPLLWVGRQQPDWVGTVDPRVAKRAYDITSALTRAVQPVPAFVVEPARD